MDNDAQAIIDSTAHLVAASYPPQELEPGKRYAFVLPGHGDTGATLHQVDTLAAAATPERAVGTVDAHTATGFQSAVKSRTGGLGDLRLYANRPQRVLTAILNDDTAAGPGWRDNRVNLALKPTPEWEHWKNNQGLKPLPEFGHIIEDGIDEITTPSSAVMLEVAQNFTAAIDVKFVEAKRLANGQRQLVYQENVDATAGSATIPEEFTLTLVPYFGSEPQPITARLRYEVRSGQLRIGYVLVKPDRFEQAAFDAIVADVAEGLGVDAIEASAPSAASAHR